MATSLLKTEFFIPISCDERATTSSFGVLASFFFLHPVMRFIRATIMTSISPSLSNQLGLWSADSLTYILTGFVTLGTRNWPVPIPLLTVNLWGQLIQTRRDRGKWSYLVTLQKMVVILSHSSFRKTHKSSIFSALSFLSYDFHTFSIRFISGLYGAHFITAIPSSARKFNKVLALWQGALSCINIGVSTVPLRKWGRKNWWRSSLLTLALILPLKRTMGPTPAEEIILPHYYAPPTKFHSFLNTLRR